MILLLHRAGFVFAPKLWGLEQCRVKCSRLPGQIVGALPTVCPSSAGLIAGQKSKSSLFPV